MFQVDLCIFSQYLRETPLIYFLLSVFSPLASPLWTSLILSLWLIWNDKASGVTYVCYRLLCHRMTCEGLLPPTVNRSIGHKHSEWYASLKTRWGRLRRDALGRYFAAHLLGNAPRKIASVTQSVSVMWRSPVDAWVRQIQKAFYYSLAQRTW